MFLTDVRTGIGGTLANHRLARANSKNVLVVGTGVQARMQIEAHAKIFTNPLSFRVWGRDIDKGKQVVSDMAGFDVSASQN